jgi:hypothetical protein
MKFTVIFAWKNFNLALQKSFTDLFMIHLNNVESKNVESKNVEMKMSKTKISKIKMSNGKNVEN